MPRELHPICNIHQGLLSLLALKLFSSSAASSNTQKSGPARFPPLLSLTSPVPPSHITHTSSPLYSLTHSPKLPCTPLPSHIPFARACTVLVCVCVCFLCACVRPDCTSYDKHQACQVGCFLFCASAPRLLSTRLHGAERELEVQRARCQGHGRRLHAHRLRTPAQQQQHQQTNRPLLAYRDATRRLTT
ncbi:hypothetical protein F5883DRAFT_81040 [Diaporthe sp. PMI_573]|nr:hypothetical protein F5883DRAFT_81040 [Diaporthaceae sp. PMI_573]